MALKFGRGVFGSYPESASSHRPTTRTRQPVMRTTLQLRSGQGQERTGLLRPKSVCTHRRRSGAWVPGRPRHNPWRASSSGSEVPRTAHETSEICARDLSARSTGFALPMAAVEGVLEAHGRSSGPREAQFDRLRISVDARQVSFDERAVVAQRLPDAARAAPRHRRGRWVGLASAAPLDGAAALRAPACRVRSAVRSDRHSARPIAIAFGCGDRVVKACFPAPIEGLRVSRLAMGEPSDVALSTTARAAGSGGSEHIR